MPDQPAEKIPPPQRQSVGRAPVPEASVRIAPRFLRVGVIEYCKPGFVRSHRHDEHEVILIDEGTYDCTVNGVRMTLKPGEGVVVQPGDWHEDFFDTPLRYFGLVFDLESDPLRPAPPGMLVPELEPQQQCFRINPETTRPLLRGLLQEGDAPDPASGHIQDALLLAFFWHLVRALPPEAVNPAFLALSGDQAFPSQLMRLFRAHVNKDLTVAEMASLLHMSESSLAHKCTEFLGISPRKAFLKCRMERAQYLLVNTDLSVKEIAAELGFEDPYGFSRTFKTVCGMSPAHWREQQPC